MENVYELLYMHSMRDDYALTRLVKTFDPLIKATIKTLNQKTNNVFNFDDVYQELSITLLDSVYHYRDDYGYSFGSFLKKCLVNKAASIYREIISNKTKANYDTLSLDSYVSEDVESYRYELIEQKDSFNNPSYIYEFKETFNAFKDYYEHLNELDKQVLVCYLSKMKYIDAAQLLEISKKSYDNKLQKLKKDIKIVFHRV